MDVLSHFMSLVQVRNEEFREIQSASHGNGVLFPLRISDSVHFSFMHLTASNSSEFMDAFLSK